ncbi:MAG: hypothetical protein PHW76_09435 [Alphaproteobacteria bacterium]|nr:hypothetical protein [Alphaproteobacteria bacterium]
MIVSLERAGRGLSRRIQDFIGEVLLVFQRPFNGLPIVLWAYFVIAYIALPNNIWRGNLLDSDDYTYLSHTLDWIQGQGWFDNVQHRMNPPEGVPLHFTRIANLPMAAVIFGFHSLGYSFRGAALLTAFLLPLCYLAAFFWVLSATAARFVPKDWARLSAFVAIFASGLMSKFAPSQVDHHGLVVILTMGALALTAQTFLKPSEAKFSIGAGFLYALATAVALEALPWMAIGSAAIGLWAVANGARARKAAVCFGMSLFLAGSAFLTLKTPLLSIFTLDLLSYSIAYVVLMGGIAAALLIAAASGRIGNIFVRFAVVGIAAIGIGATYLYHFPQLLLGPYGAMDPKLAAMFFANVGEAVPAVRKLTPQTMYPCILLCVAVVTSGLRICEGQGGKKWAWGVLTACLATAFGLMMFYQSRLVIYAQAFSIIPLVSLAERALGRIEHQPQGRGRVWAEIGIVALVGPLFTVLMPAVYDGRSFNTGVLMFPMRISDDPCDLQAVAKVLEAPPYSGRNLRILNTINQGAGLLFFTRHSVFSAPYHTNVAGNMAATEFFSAADPGLAEGIARRNKADMVVFCRYVPTMYFGKQDRQTDKELRDDARSGFGDKSLAFQLVSGKPPEWLKKVPLPSSWVDLYEVLPENGGKERR